jgi:hypothetical protein
MQENDPEALDILKRYHFDAILGRYRSFPPRVYNYLHFETDTFFLQSGTYAVVRRAWDVQTGEQFACKIVDKRKAGIRATDNSMLPLNDHSEIRILLEIQHVRFSWLTLTRQETHMLHP